jgi:hypothetical protein
MHVFLYSWGESLLALYSSTWTVQLPMTRGACSSHPVQQRTCIGATTCYITLKNLKISDTWWQQHNFIAAAKETFHSPRNKLLSKINFKGMSNVANALNVTDIILLRPCDSYCASYDKNTDTIKIS